MTVSLGVSRMESGELRLRLQRAAERLREGTVRPDNRLAKEADTYLSSLETNLESYKDIPQFYPKHAQRFSSPLYTHVKERLKQTSDDKFRKMVTEPDLLAKLFQLVDSKGVQVNAMVPTIPGEPPPKSLSYTRYKQIAGELSKCYPAYTELFYDFFSASNFARLTPVPKSLTLVTPSVYASDVLHSFLRQYSIASMAVKLSLFDANGDGYIDEEELGAFIDAQLPNIPALIPSLSPLEPFHACVVKKGIWFHCNENGRQLVSISDIVTNETFALFCATFEECPLGTYGMTEPSPNAVKILTQILSNSGNYAEPGVIQKLYFPPPMNWFSVANTIELYTRFAELDEREQGFLEPENLKGFTGLLANPKSNPDYMCGGLTGIAIERILEQLQTYGENRKVDFKVFIDIVLAYRWPKKPNAQLFFFQLADMFSQGYVTRFSLRPFVRETMERLKDEFLDGPPDTEDVIDQIFDDMEPNGGKEGLVMSKVEKNKCRKDNGRPNGLKDNKLFTKQNDSEHVEMGLNIHSNSGLTEECIKTFNIYSKKSQRPALRLEDVEKGCHRELLGISCTDPSSFLEFDQQEQAMADNQNDSIQLPIPQPGTYYTNTYQSQPRVVHEV